METRPSDRARVRDASLRCRCRRAVWGRKLRRQREHVPKGESGRDGPLDPRRRLRRLQLLEARDERVQVSPARGVRGDLAERRDRHGLAQLRSALHDASVISNTQPASTTVGVVEGAQEHPPSGGRLRRDHARDHVTRLRVRARQTRSPLDVFGEAHVARIRVVSSRTAHARALFAPLGPSYDRVGAVLSLGQDPLWRRFLVSRLPADRGHVLDVATGTGLVAAELLRGGFRVTGLDQSGEMLAVARRRLGETRSSCRPPPRPCPFRTQRSTTSPSPICSATSTIRASTLAELARVVRPGGTVASLEFGVPRGPRGPSGISTSGSVCHSQGGLAKRVGRGRRVSRTLDP